jgi:hypothetical protein
MAERRIRTYGPRGEPIPKHIFADHDWVREHEEELIKQYGHCYIIVHHEKVLGTGKSYQEAIDNAELNLLPDSPAIQVIVDWIGHHHRIHRVRTTEDDHGSD